MMPRESDSTRCRWDACRRHANGCMGIFDWATSGRRCERCRPTHTLVIDGTAAKPGQPRALGNGVTNNPQNNNLIKVTSKNSAPKNAPDMAPSQFSGVFWNFLD